VERGAVEVLLGRQWHRPETALYTNRGTAIRGNPGNSAWVHSRAHILSMKESSVHESKGRGLGMAGWLAIVTLGIVLGLAVWFAFYGWNLTTAQVSTNGYVALTLGIVMSMLLGGGLMALVFYSNRKGYDR
jgi:hypothetical protein